MKTLKGRFIKTNILMVVISAALVSVSSLLLLFIFCINDHKQFINSLESISLAFKGRLDLKNSLSLYLWVFGIFIAIIVVIICIVLSMKLINIIVKPIQELNRAAINMLEGNLDYDVLSCEDQEINKLCLSFDEIRKKLRENAEKEYNLSEERKMLIANLSHDMRTPITTIKGYLEGIKDGVAASPEKMEQYFDTIYTKTLVLENLVDNLTEYSELELGRMQYVFEYVDISAYLIDLVDEYEMDICKKGFKLNHDIEKKEAIVVADRNKLKRVMDNLVGNAIKYNQTGGSINIKTGSDDRGVLICISDSGKGIKKSDLEKVFDGFYRGDSARSNIKGNGLGLAISKQIVESHHGKIWIKSEENRGTEVYIYLPIRRKQNEDISNRG